MHHAHPAATAADTIRGEFTAAELRVIYRALELATVAASALASPRHIGVQMLRNRVRAMLTDAGEAL